MNGLSTYTSNFTLSCKVLTNCSWSMVLSCSYPFSLWPCFSSRFWPRGLTCTARWRQSKFSPVGSYSTLSYSSYSWRRIRASEAPISSLTGSDSMQFWRIKRLAETGFWLVIHQEHDFRLIPKKRFQTSLASTRVSTLLLKMLLKFILKCPCIFGSSTSHIWIVINAEARGHHLPDSSGNIEEGCIARRDHCIHDAHVGFVQENDKFVAWKKLRTAVSTECIINTCWSRQKRSCRDWELPDFHLAANPGLAHKLCTRYIHEKVILFLMELRSLCLLSGTTQIPDFCCCLCIMNIFARNNFHPLLSIHTVTDEKREVKQARVLRALFCQPSDKSKMSNFQGKMAL